jgi:hypothetical protein
MLRFLQNSPTVKPFSLEIILKRSKHLYKKLAYKPIILKPRIIAGEAKKPLPLLATNGISVEAFCTAFNEQTQGLTSVRIPAQITIDHTKKYTFFLKSPNFQGYLTMLNFRLLKRKFLRRKYTAFFKIFCLILLLKFCTLTNQDFKDLRAGFRGFDMYYVFKTQAEQNKSLFFKRKKKG